MNPADPQVVVSEHPEDARQTAIAQSLADAGIATPGRRTAFLAALNSRGFDVRSTDDRAGDTHTGYGARPCPYDGLIPCGCGVER